MIKTEISSEKHNKNTLIAKENSRPAVLSGQLCRIVDGLVSREGQLKTIIQDAERRVKNAPEGAVRIIKHGNGYQFYHRTDPKDTSGVYIPVSQSVKVQQLIQKKYDMQILTAARKELAVLENFLDNYNGQMLKEVYEAANAARKRYIIPAELPDKEYISAWLAFEYPKKPFAEGAPEHYTEKNERVRSKSEVLIANALLREGIPYRYECPLRLEGAVTIHPDFTVLRVSDRKEFYWEHLGLLDDSEYRNNALNRILIYERNGLFPGDGLIITAETYKQPLNIASVKRVIRHYLV